MSLAAMSAEPHLDRTGSTLRSTHCRHAEPTNRKAVPSNAVRILKMKKAARLGANAVPMLHPKKRNAVVAVIYSSSLSVSILDRLKISRP